MPLYTWLDVYRHRIPTGSARLSYNVPFPRYRLFSFSLFLSSSLLSPSSSTMSSATASSSSKSSASSYESCDLIDRIASLPLGISRLCSHCLPHSLFLLHLYSRFSPIPVSCSHPFDELRCVVTSAVGLSRDLGYDSITSVEAMKNTASSKNRQLSKYFKRQRARPILRDHGTRMHLNALPLRAGNCVRLMRITLM